MAERAGVSVATASRSLRGSANVAAETRRRVVDAADALGYVAPLRSAEEAAHHRPQLTVAVIVPDISSWFVRSVACAAVNGLREHRCEVVLYNLGNCDAVDHFFSRLALAGRVDGVMPLAMPLTDEQAHSLGALDLPLVSVAADIDGSPSVGIDEVGAARAATNYLLNLGHERVGLIAGSATGSSLHLPSSEGRRLGYQEALRGRGIEPDERWTAVAGHGAHGGAAAMAELLAGTVIPTAVLAEHDELAFGALWTLRRAGLRVPRDISVIGIDDHELAQVTGLTTMAQNPTQQGQIAAHMLLQMMGAAPGTREVEQIRLPTSMQLRSTTSAIDFAGRTLLTLSRRAAVVHSAASAGPATERVASSLGHGAPR